MNRAGLFSPYRAIGYITSDIPCNVQTRGQAYFITSSIGKTFQIYNAEKMNLLFVGEMLDSPIISMTCYRDTVFCSTFDEIIAFERGKQIYKLEQGNVSNLLVLGEILFAVHGNELQMWDYDQRELLNTICLNESQDISCILHPSTYVNKILISSGSNLYLYNFKTIKRIFAFPDFNSPITFLAQSPSIDVIAIGLLNGTIIIYNIKVDKEIMRFHQDHKVTAISFRSDGTHTMATSSMTGDIALWDLGKKRLIHLLHAHDSAIHTCIFFNGMNVLLTAGQDNSIKQWIFDSSDGVPRLLKSRSGHHKPPTMIKFYGSEGRTILSCGQDLTLRSFSLIRDSQNTELSQGTLEKKAKKYNTHIDNLRLNSIINFDANDSKQKDWDNIITCHSQESFCKTWSFQRKAIGKLQLDSKDQTAVKCVALSACGNFGFLGTLSGRIDKFNMQSGIFRGSYIGHFEAVTGIVSDNVNQVVVSASLDKQVIFWDFHTCKLVEKLSLPDSISHILLAQSSRLLAVICDDMLIRIIDLGSKKIVRIFAGHENRITAITFSSDERWLISGSLDGSIRTWDLPSGNMIDAFQIPELPTSISMSPTDDFLATTHVNHVGIFLWANRSQYENITLRKLEPNEVRNASLPCVNPEMVQDEEELADMEISRKEYDNNVVDDTISFSTLPSSRWQNLLNIEAIKKRNKPIEPIKEPEKAPFFLATTAGAIPQFVVETPTENPSKRIKFDQSANTVLIKFLEQGHDLDNCKMNLIIDEKFFEHLKSLGPSAIDAEFQMFPTFDDLHHFKLFFSAIRKAIESRKDFELAQAYLCSFLKAKRDLL